jgi:PAS domain S-box-containing protein
MASPGQRNIEKYLRNNLLIFITTIFLIVVTTAFFIFTYFSTKSVFAELVAQANFVTLSLTTSQTELEEELLSFANKDDLLDGAKLDRPVLSRLYPSAQHYDQIFIVDKEQNITDSFPVIGPEYSLTGRELEAVRNPLAEADRGLVLDGIEDGEPILSVVVPVLGESGETTATIVGRVNKNSLANTLEGLTNNSPNMSGAIVDLGGKAVVGILDGETTASYPLRFLAQSLVLPNLFGGTTSLGMSNLGAPQLIYKAPAGNHDWRIAVSAPIGTILMQGLVASLILGGGLFAIAAFFYTSMNNFGRELSRSITDLTRVSQKIADDITLAPRGENNREDELGDLSRALDEMRRALKKRLDDQAILLSVSRESSASFELADSLPIVLHGALRGTGAAGARALVLNPGTGHPVSYAEGPAADSMQVFDKKLLALMRQEEELLLSSLQSIIDKFEISPSADISIKALYALPLHVENKFLGFLVVGYRNQREFSETDLEFLKFLARQASIQIQKSYLYTYAEGGRKRLTAVLDSTSDPVIVTDPTARILRVNRATEKVFDIDADRVNGRKVADVIDSPALVKALTTKESPSRDLEIKGKDNLTYFANTSLIISHEGHALGHVTVLHDVTQLKEIDRLKTEFIDNVSHDMRTPLTVLSGYASALALVEDLTPEQRKYTDNILLSVERMIELVEDLLDLGKIEAGVDLKFEDVEIGPLLKDLADEHWLFAYESGVRLRVRIADNLTPVYCDRILIKQAVSNLLMNGFKYAPNSGDMTIAGDLVGDELFISVRDRGPGIADEDQLRLFEKFYRIKRHGSGGVKGSGLGLAMVKGIAEKHGGRAWCKSAEGKGSTFFLAIPIENHRES